MNVGIKLTDRELELILGGEGTVGGFLGAVGAGAVVGAVTGSVVPGAGTVTGAVAGALIGGSTYFLDQGIQMLYQQAVYAYQSF
jgi:hypothetical protein